VTHAKDDIVARLVIERAYVTHAQLDEALTSQRHAQDQMNMDLSLLQVLTSKRLLSSEQEKDIEQAVAVETGEAYEVGGYKVVEKIGQGSFGAVFKAQSTATGETVALKILLPARATPYLIERFERESRIVSTLDHQHIVRCVEFGRDPKRNCHYCALEYIEGENLQQRVDRLGVIPEAEALSITTQMAKALQHAYWNGLVHRDVKPDNIVVMPDGTAKLLDLGLARPNTADMTSITQSGDIVGSPHYMSPEQAKSSKDVDIRADIYSLGCTLYFMVTGKPPFDGETALMVVQQHVYGNLRSPAELNPDLSAGVCRLVTRMMARDPDDRYQEPKELLRDIDALLKGNGHDRPDMTHSNTPAAQASRQHGKRRRPASGPRHGRPASSPKLNRVEEAHEDAAGGRRRPLGRKIWPRAKMLATLGAIVSFAAAALWIGSSTLGTKEKRPKDRKGDREEADSKTTDEPPPPRPVPNEITRVLVREVEGGLELALGDDVVIELVMIQAGEYEMGSHETDPTVASRSGFGEKMPMGLLWAHPQHRVVITRPFYLGKHEVTQAQYERVVGEDRNHSCFKKDKDLSRPVERVSWHDATEFCRILTSRLESRAGTVGESSSAAAKGNGAQPDGGAEQDAPASFVVRLPTEAEWEYACRAGTTTAFHCGGSLSSEAANFNGNYPYPYVFSVKGPFREMTTPVGTFPASAWGLHDMHGNVSEWVSDWADERYYEVSPTEGPAGPDGGEKRVIRGGSWCHTASHCRSASRMEMDPKNCASFVGFRVVVSR